jgi:hypothetical protein
MRWYWWGLLVLLLSLASYALAIRIVNSFDYLKNGTDFSSFWLAGQLMLQGKSPYDIVSWGEGFRQFELGFLLTPVFLYPLPLALLFAPFGILSFHTAYIVWVALSIMMILVTLALLLKTQAGSRYIAIPLITGIVFFRPTILTLFNGQISGWLLLLLTITVHLWEKGKWELGSLLLPLLMLKPNLGVPLVFLLGIWLLFQKRFKSILAMLLMGIVLLVIGFLQDPHWVSAYWNIGNTKVSETFGGSPTVWGLSALFIHNNLAGMLTLGGLGALLVLLVFFIAVFRPGPARKPLTVIALAITVTLLVTPYTWTYDQLLLLIPITGVTFAMYQAGYRFSITAAIFLIIDLLAFLLFIPNFILGIEILNAIIPLTVLGLCIWWIITLPS